MHRLTQFEDILSTKNIDTEPTIDLYKFRHLCFRGEHFLLNIFFILNQIELFYNKRKLLLLACVFWYKFN